MELISRKVLIINCIRKKHEHTVIVHLDKIYDNRELHFKGDNILGCSKTDLTQVAKTGQVFYDF